MTGIEQSNRLVDLAERVTDACRESKAAADLSAAKAIESRTLVHDAEQADPELPVRQFGKTPPMPPERLAIRLCGDARSYVEAAKVLDERCRSEHLIHRIFLPTYFLLCHAIELTLKAFLASKGVKENVLRDKIRHDIKLAHQRAEKLSFVPADDRFPELIDWLGPYHTDHLFRYPKTGLVSLPIPAEAIAIVDKTLAVVEPQVRERARDMLRQRDDPKGRAE